MKNNELIDLLEEKYMDNDTINAILNHCNHHNDVDIIKVINDIYDIFSFVGLSNDYIEVLIKKNISILDCSKSELLKIAYILQEVNLNDEIFSKSTIASGITNYKRVFMRNFVAKISGRYEKYNGVDFLTASDSCAYGLKYNFNKNCDVLEKGILSDEELENALNKQLKYDGKTITVDEYLNKKAISFYIKFMMYSKNKIEKTNGINAK